MTAESNATAHVADFHWWRGSPDLPHELAELRDLAALRDAVEEGIARQITDLRAVGIAWSAIGSELGVSRQAVQKRYGRDDVPA